MDVHATTEVDDRTCSSGFAEDNIRAFRKYSVGTGPCNWVGPEEALSGSYACAARDERRHRSGNLSRGRTDENGHVTANGRRYRSTLANDRVYLRTRTNLNLTDCCIRILQRDVATVGSQRRVSAYGQSYVANSRPTGNQIDEAILSCNAPRCGQATDCLYLERAAGTGITQSHIPRMRNEHIAAVVNFRRERTDNYARPIRCPDVLRRRTYAAGIGGKEDRPCGYGLC